MQALESATKTKLDESSPKPNLDNPTFSEQSSAQANVNSPWRTLSGASSNGFNFAPTVSYADRFTAHMDVVEAAIRDARDRLRILDVSSADPSSREGIMAAYDNLRRDLGTALKECERARVPLLETMKEIRNDVADASFSSAGADDVEDVPMLVTEDHSSPTSSRGGGMDLPPESPTRGNHRSHRTTSSVIYDRDDLSRLDEIVDDDEDDASAYLLLATSSRHLPSPGAEQVFESEAAAASYKRERTTLSRAERIALSKARREKGESILAHGSGGDSEREGSERLRPERWGPGGDVVQELKDVIGQVGERRRHQARESSAEARDSTFSTPLVEASADGVAG